MRLIDADDLIKRFLDHNRTEFEIKNCCMANENVIAIIDNAPTVEIPTELCKGCRFLKDCETCEEKLRPPGEWYYNYQNGWHCSICHETVKDMPTVKGKADYNFCPRCGADMRGDKNDT